MRERSKKVLLSCSDKDTLKRVNAMGKGNLINPSGKWEQQLCNQADRRTDHANQFITLWPIACLAMDQKGIVPPKAKYYAISLSS